MTSSDKTTQIIEKAKSLGASLAGIASVDLLRKSPSHKMYENHERYEEDDEGKSGISWPEEAKSAIVIALLHKNEEPELDWWGCSQGTPGNRILIKISRALSEWIKQELGINAHDLPYYIEKGGTFLKDAGVMAGLGCIGKNNLLLTPEFGPRVRLRALLLDEDVTPTGPISFDPCADCDAPCRKACPQKACRQPTDICPPVEMGKISLPGRSGCYNRILCNIQMEKDIEVGKVVTVKGEDKPFKVIKYCRRCELACPVGK